MTSTSTSFDAFHEFKWHLQIVMDAVPEDPLEGLLGPAPPASPLRRGDRDWNALMLQCHVHARKLRWHRRRLQAHLEELAERIQQFKSDAFEEADSD